MYKPFEFSANSPSRTGSGRFVETPGVARAFGQVFK
jgi:hypothetical protein